jgi:hypothetical protein
MSDFPTSLRVIAAYKAGEDLADRLASAITVQQSMSVALRKAADEIERLEALRVEDGKQMSVLIAECQEMKDRLVDGDDVKISCKKTDDASDSYAKGDEKHGVADTNRATLTAEEREAIAFGIACVTTDKRAATLLKLLERLQ